MISKMADSLKLNYVFGFLLVSFLFHCLNCENFKRLIPEQIVTNEHLYHNESRIYLLTYLHQEHHYELRISYPATIPTEFLIKLSRSLPFHHHGRKLMNIEKLVFKHNKNEQYAIVTAVRVGLPQDPERLNDPVYFNIILEKLYLGLPWEVWKTGVLILLSLTITLASILPKVQDLFEQEKIKWTKNM